MSWPSTSLSMAIRSLVVLTASSLHRWLFVAGRERSSSCEIIGEASVSHSVTPEGVSTS